MPGILVVEDDENLNRGAELESELPVCKFKF